MTAADMGSRTVNSARNAGAAVLGQAVVICLGFLTRTFFLHYLGVEQLGVQALLTSLLAMVAIADFGFSWALMYSLYAPLEQRDDRKVAAVVRYAARLYRWVALGVALLGLALVPFLDVFLGNSDVPAIELYYLVMLAGTVAYFPLYHRVLLLEADQRAYWTRLVTIALNVVRAAFQIAVLVVWQSFVGYLAIQVATNVCVNLVVHVYVRRKYTYLNLPGELDRHERREINAAVRAMFVYRVSGLALNNTGPVVISVLLGASTLGYWSNFMLLIGSCVMILEVVFSSLAPSIGNLIAGGHRKSVRRVLDEAQLLAILLYGTSAAILIISAQQFVAVWLGPEFLVSGTVLYCAVASYYVTGAIMPITVFRSATGMFKEARYVLALAACLNLVLAFALGSVIGLAGVVVAPLIARLATNVWLEPFFLFRSYVDGGMFSYFKIHALSLSAIVVSVLALEVALSELPTSWFAVLIRAVASGVLTLLLLIATFSRMPAWVSLRRRVRLRLRHS